MNPSAPEGTQLWYVYQLLEKHGSTWGGIGDDWRCPAHEDANASLGVSQGVKGVVLHCAAGCEPVKVLEALGTTWQLVFQWEPGEPGTETAGETSGETSGPASPRTIEALAEAHGGLRERTVYPYRTVDGEKVRIVVRFDFEDGTKTIRQKIIKPGAVLYRQSMVTKAIELGLPIYVVEGEKSADRVNAIAKSKDGVRQAVATCNPGGAKGWTDDHGTLLDGAKRVVIVADRDQAGRDWARAVSDSISLDVPFEVKQSGTMGKGHDVVDHLDAGLKIKHLVPLILDVPVPPEDGNSQNDPDEPDGDDDPDEERISPMAWPTPNQPREVAIKLAEETRHDDGFVTIRHWRDEWFVWRERLGYFEQVELKAFKGQIGAELAKHRYKSSDGEFVPWTVTEPRVTGVLKMLESLPEVFVPAYVRPGYRFGDDARGPLRDLLCLTRSVVDLTVGNGYKELAPSPLFFTLSALPYEFDHSAECARWDAFLSETFAGDVESVALLQEWFGYVLTADTSAQKFLSIYGPPGSGKTTIDRVLKAMLGEGDVEALDVTDLAEPFGMAKMARARLAVIGDASWGLRDNDAVVAKLKALVGENTIKINEKFEKAYATKPTARLLLVSNERPAFRDPSGALMRRLMLLETHATVSPERRSAALFDELVAQMPGIIQWSLVGLARLRRRQREGRLGGSAFTVPVSTLSELEEVARSQSEIMAFVEDRCELAASAWVATSELADAYREWQQEQGIQHGVTNSRFSRELRSAYKLTPEHRGNAHKGTQKRGLAGIRLLSRNARVGA